MAIHMAMKWPRYAYGSSHALDFSHAFVLSPAHGRTHSKGYSTDTALFMVMALAIAMAKAMTIARGTPTHGYPTKMELATPKGFTPY